jgi:hypothetical protein
VPQFASLLVVSHRFVYLAQVMAVHVAPEEIGVGRVRGQADGGREVCHCLVIFALADPNNSPFIIDPGVQWGQLGGPVKVCHGFGKTALLSLAFAAFFKSLGASGVAVDGLGKDLNRLSPLTHSGQEVSLGNQQLYVPRVFGQPFVELLQRLGFSSHSSQGLGVVAPGLRHLGIALQVFAQ